MPLATSTLVKPSGKVWAVEESCSNIKKVREQKTGTVVLNEVTV
jgi:hypothetical protein